MGPKQIRKAQKIGFCYGVQSALSTVQEYAQKHPLTHTWGDIVHNSLVVQGLKEQGVQVVSKVEDISTSLIIIPAHGVSPEIIEKFHESNIKIIDTTCPFVRRAQITAESYSQNGFFTVVFGDKNHAEIKGILGWAGPHSLAAKKASELENIPVPLKIGLLSQTTQKPLDFIKFCQEVMAWAFTKDSELHITDTICHDIRRRQQDALELASWADLIVVIGSPNSANTKNLLELCSSVTQAEQVEKASDLLPSMVEGYNKIGIVAGASTDDQAIDGIYQKLLTL